MKKFVWGLICLFCVMFVACSSNDDVVDETFTLSTTELQFDSEVGNQVINVTSAVSPTIQKDGQDWYDAVKSFPQGSGSTTVHPIKVIVRKNTSPNSRSAQLTISCGNSSPQIVTIIQSALTFLELSKNSLAFIGADKDSQVVKIKSSSDPRITASADWIVTSVSSVSSTDGFDVTLTVSVKENMSLDAGREGTIQISNGADTETIKVQQDAARYQPDYNNCLVPGDIPAISGSAEEAIAFANSLGLGWNLGNHFDAHNNGVSSETAWGNPKATQETFNKVKAAGISSVRIPVTYLGHIGAAPGYIIDADYLNRVAEVVGYAKKAGLKVIINIHHDGADSAHWLNIKSAAIDAAANKKVKDQLAAMWTQIANKFKNEGNYLIFEPFNEIHDGGWGWGANREDGGKQYACLNEWNQVFVDAVRATGGNNTDRYLAVVGYCANPEITMETLNLPKDSAKNRLVVGVHYYNPTTFSLECKFNEWGHTAVKTESYGSEKDVQWIFNNLKTTYIDKGIPVYMGEMGCTHFAEETGEKFRRYYLEYICKAVREYGMAPLVWDNGSTTAGAESHGYFNHGTGDYIGNSAEMIEIMKHAYYTNDPKYTLDFVYDGAPKNNN